jgi:hypothetical protein
VLENPEEEEKTQGSDDLRVVLEMATGGDTQEKEVDVQDPLGIIQTSNISANKNKTTRTVEDDKCVKICVTK